MAENVGEIFYTVDAKTGQLQRSSRDARGQLDGLQKSMEETDRSSAKLGGGLTKLAQSFAALASAAAIANEFKKAVAVSAQFNATISNLSAITGAVGKDLEFLRQTALEFGRTTTLSASQAAEALKLVASAKPDLLKSGAALKAVTREAVTLAEAAGITLPQAAEALTTTLNQFNLGAEESGRIINVLAAGAKEGSSEIAQTVAVLKNAGVVAAQSGLSIETFNGAVQALAKGAITGAEAGTGLRNVLTILNTQTDSRLKPSVVGLSQALANLEAQGLDDTQMVKLFGRENITTAQVLQNNRNVLDDVTRAITGTGEAYRQAQVNTDNLQTDTEKLGKAYEALQIQIGSLADDTLRSLTQQLTAAVGAMAENGDAIESAFEIAGVAALSFSAIITGRVIMALAGYAAATIAAATAALTATPAIVGMSSVLGVQATRATAATVAMNAAAIAAGVLRRAMALLGGPAGLVLLAAVAIAEFTAKSETAADRTAELDAKVKSLSASFKDLSATQLNAKLAEFSVEAAELEGRIERLKNKQVEANKEFVATSGVLGGSATSIGKYSAATKDLAEQDTEGLDLTQRLDANKQAADAARAALEQLKTAAATPAADPPATIGVTGGGGDGKAAKKAAKDQADGIADNVKAIQQLQEALVQAGMAGTVLAQRQAELSLNKYATPEQIALVRELAGALEEKKQAEANKQLLGQVDPMAAEQQAFALRMQQIRQLEEAEVLSKQRSLELQMQAQVAHEDQLRVLQEENFRRQSAGNELLLASLDQLQQGATDALVGLATGASNGEDAVRSLATAILREAVGSLVQMGVQQVKNLVMGQATAAAATAAGVAQAATLATAWATPAALVSLASFGANAAPAAAALSGTVGLAQGLSAVGGRQYGGGVNAGSMYRVNEGGAPEVFQGAGGKQYMLPNTRGEVVSNADASAGGGANVQVHVNLIESPDKGGQVSQRREGNTEMVDVFVADIRGGGPMSRTLEQTYPLKRAGQ